MLDALEWGAALARTLGERQNSAPLGVSFADLCMVDSLDMAEFTLRRGVRITFGGDVHGGR